MASRDEVYTKFGVTAEAAQLFETELGNMMLAAKGLQANWMAETDVTAATDLHDKINKYTLGRLLSLVRGVIEIEDALIDHFQAALESRNKLMHGFYLLHGFKIDSDDGRDEMIADLHRHHELLFNAWRIASRMSGVLMDYMLELKANPEKLNQGPVSKIQFK